MEWIFLVLAVVVIAFGIGVLVVNRRRSGAAGAPSPPGRRTDHDDRRDANPPSHHPTSACRSEQPPVVEPVRPASLRDRMAKARSAFTGAFVGVLGRSAITDETWDDLEEALLRADVGVAVTDALLDDLKTRVKAKEITEPGALLDALQADMAERLAGADRDAALRRRCRREPERVAVRRRQRRRQDHHDRQGRQPADAPPAGRC